MSLKLNFDYAVSSSSISKLETFKKIISSEKTQFFHTFERKELIESSKKVYQQFRSRKLFVHVGIGGSSLGPEMLISALAKNDTQFLFINNIDPEEIHNQLRVIERVGVEHTLFYFVSKSGGTAETQAALAIITEFLKNKNIYQSDLKNYFVFATDPQKSELLNLGLELQINCLEVPSDVGGRFCALTPVGYLPALFAGIDIDQLVSGAIALQTQILDASIHNPLLRAAEYLMELKNNHGVNQTVLMPYSSKLRAFSFWFTQLWAESLGKKKNLSGEIVYTGLTPIVGFGATDQHSQMQLFMEGPKDKCLIFVEIEKFSHDFSLNSSLSTPSLKKLSAHDLSELIKAELKGTMKALCESTRPFIHVTIDKNDEYHMGQLILFFESLTAFVGQEYLKIDPFDQPGVEAGKIYAFEILNQLK
jgi:glucose-6-phosphate isomerase